MALTARFLKVVGDPANFKEQSVALRLRLQPGN